MSDQTPEGTLGGTQATQATQASQASQASQAQAQAQTGPSRSREQAPSEAVASNAEPTTQHDDYATEARDVAVEKIAERYEENGESEAADKVRERFQDSPADQAGETLAGGTAAPTV